MPCPGADRRNTTHIATERTHMEVCAVLHQTSSRGGRGAPRIHVARVGVRSQQTLLCVLFASVRQYVV